VGSTIAFAENLVRFVWLPLRPYRVRGILEGTLAPGEVSIDNARLQVAHILGDAASGNEALPETRLLRYREPLPRLDVVNYQDWFESEWLSVDSYQHCGPSRTARRIRTRSSSQRRSVVVNVLPSTLGSWMVNLWRPYAKRHLF
jgi:hypothetical protein